MLIEKIVIIIPTYNEALVIEKTLLQLFMAAEAISDKEIHVLVFDSNSRDNTQEIVSRLQAIYKHLHLKTEPQKMGLGAAYLQAMHYALSELSADIVIEFDADLSHQPKYIAPMLENLKNHDVVVGSRYIAGGCIPRNWGWHRKLLSILGNYVARLLLTTKYKDFTSGFRATRHLALKKALPEQFISNHYAYKLELLWTLHKNKARIAEHPIEFVDRIKGQSKLPANSISDSLRVVFLLRFKELSGYFNMCLIGLSGMLIQALVYNILRQNLSPFNAAQWAVMAAMLNNFTLNKRFTFKNRSQPSSIKKIKAFSLFIGYSILMIQVQSYWLKWGVQHLGSGYLKENILLGLGVLIGSVLNYKTYSRMIWPLKKPQKS